MRNRISVLLVSLVVALACAVPASADTTTVSLVSWANTWGYYTGTVGGTLTSGGTQTNIVCDDDKDNVVDGERWMAYVGNTNSYSTNFYWNVGNASADTYLANLSLGAITNQQLYNMIGDLARQILTGNNSQPDLSYAIWALTSSTTPPDPSGVATDVENAYVLRDQSFDVNVYTPVGCAAGVWGSSSCASEISGQYSNSPPQEMLTISEANTSWLLVLAFLAVPFVLRKRRLA